MLFTTLSCFALPSLAVLLPGPPGPHSVSYQVHDLVDETRWDPYAPSDSPHKRAIVVSSYLPIGKGEDCKTTELPYMPPQTTVAYGKYAADNGLPDDIFEDLQLEFCQSSKCTGEASGRHPLVLFSPGLSASRLLYTAQARALASYGFLVVTVDHPYDATFVELSNGTSFQGTVGFTPEESELAVKVRSADVSFVIDLFEYPNDSASLPPALVQRANLDKVFAYGHSLGGATAAETAFLDDRVLGGVDIDGSPWGQSKKLGLDKPIVMSGKGTANGIDETWAPFYDKLTGPKLQMRVEGATHYSYIDMPQILETRPLSPEYDELVKYLVGTVPGKQMERIVMGILNGFGDLVLEGDSSSLRSLNSTFEEVLFVEEDLE